MKALLALIRAEPVTLAGATSAVATLVVAFNLNVTVRQEGAIGAVIFVVLSLLARLVVQPTIPPPPPPTPSP